MLANVSNQVENTRLRDISQQTVKLDEKTDVNKELTSSDVTELERINKTRQQSLEDKKINTSVRQQVSTVHERTEVDESMKLLENYSGEVVKNIMNCGPSINLENAKQMLAQVLIDESVSKEVDGSQAIIVQGARNVVRNVKLHNMISLVGDENVYNCVAGHVNDLITKKESLLSGTSSNTGSSIKGADLSTDGSKVTDQSSTDLGTKNTNETEMKKKTDITSEMALESKTALSQKSIQDTVLDFMQGQGGSILGGIFGFIVLLIVIRIAYSMFGGSSSGDSQPWEWYHYAGLVVLLLGLVALGLWYFGYFEEKEENFCPHGCGSTPPNSARDYLSYGLQGLLVVAVAYQVFFARSDRLMVGGGRGMPSSFDIYVFVGVLLIIAVVTTSLVLF